MKLYTKNGDDGDTSLFGGQRVSKNVIRVNAFGQVDELNAALGLAAVNAPESIQQIIATLQPQLFDLGSNLCTPPEANASHIPPVTPEHITFLEQTIDKIDTQLTPMRNFILPGGSETAARLHLARTIARRAERDIITLHQAEPLNPLILQYANRLSDLLFALARHANHLQNIPDVEWKPNT